MDNNNVISLEAWKREKALEQGTNAFIKYLKHAGGACTFEESLVILKGYKFAYLPLDAMLYADDLRDTIDG